METPSFTPQEPRPGPSYESDVDSMGRPTTSSRAKAKSRRDLGILTLAMFASGIFLLAWGGYELKGAQESSNWPSTQGTIISSRVSKQTRRDSKTRRNVITYYPRVQFKYTVNGRPYTSNRIEFGGTSGGMERVAKRVVNRYPSGKKVNVYYNPKDPQYAILEAGFTWSGLFIFLGGIVFFAVGIICFRSYRRSGKQRGAFGQDQIG
ncbi:MAG: hypothetical protein DRG82_01810 [Deltaproteobacteria bacterium]|nr:MAG: hypothetical protein B1H13_04320 [Desulfobacteraceae bacterium 4484_190.3]RLB19255.1 MAG: hypothetical protein DRG82_01810 [Deltaproteobacteria bacterium]